MNRRFPELERAREEYLGPEESRSANRNLHAKEVKKFSEVVYRLAQEQEPHRSRQTFLSILQSNETKNKEKLRAAGEIKLEPSTLATSLKDRYVLRA